jgi:hypothetical protein
LDFSLVERKDACFSITSADEKSTPALIDFEDVLQYIFMHHKDERKPVEYHIAGEAYTQSIMLAFIVNTKGTGQGQGDRDAKFAAKANAKLAKLALLMHLLDDYYTKQELISRQP